MTNETKQTAVEWLEVQIDNLFISYQKGFMSAGRFVFLQHKLFQQAKEMFTKQIIDSHGDDRSYLQDDGSWKRITGEQYYEQTYGGNK